LVLRIDNSPFQPMQESARCQVDHHDLIGLLDDPVRNRFSNTDARYMPDLVIETFQVLNVHRSEYVDADVEQSLYVLPTFGALRTGYVGVWEFIYHRNLRAPGENTLRVHLLEGGIAILHLFPRNELQALAFGDRIPAAVGLEVAHNHVNTLRLQFLRLL